MRRLVGALDSVFALREVGHTGRPDPIPLATLLEVAGLDAVQVGATEEQRPAEEADVRDLARAVQRLELRIAPVPGLVKLALETRPAAVVLASEAREAPAFPMPLDFRAWGAALPPAVRTLREAGLPVRALVQADLEAVKACHAADIDGVDLHTGTVLDLPDGARSSAFERLGDAVRLAAKLRLRVGVAGGITLPAVPELLEAAPAIERVCVGRALFERALLVGADRSVRDFQMRLG